MNKVKHPFWVIVHKEIADHVHSLRFIILISIIVLTCMGALYTALTPPGHCNDGRTNVRCEGRSA